jgi:hypothetical protein
MRVHHLQTYNFQKYNFKYLHQQSVSLEEVADIVSNELVGSFISNLHTTADTFSVNSSSCTVAQYTTSPSGCPITKHKNLSFLDLHRTDKQCTQVILGYEIVYPLTYLLSCYPQWRSANIMILSFPRIE